MRRREFLGVRGGAASWSLAARAQQPGGGVHAWARSNGRFDLACGFVLTPAHRRRPEKCAHFMSKEGKHHYIPVFYLKQWAGADGRICEFSKPYDRVKARRVFPDATAYVHGLYRIPGLPPHEADFLESYFFKLTDDLAAKALQILLGGARTLNFSPKIKSGWSRVIASLMMRRSMLAAKALYDQSRADLQADYAKHRNPTDPPTYEEYAALHSPNPAGRGGAILSRPRARP
jgi:hypothetical protein